MKEEMTRRRKIAWWNARGLESWQSQPVDVWFRESCVTPEKAQVNTEQKDEQPVSPAGGMSGA